MLYHLGVSKLEWATSIMGQNGQLLLQVRSGCFFAFFYKNCEISQNVKYEYDTGL